MESPLNFEASYEDRFCALTAWWVRHNKDFSLWYLLKNREAQLALLLKSSPDLPVNTPATRESQQVQLKATDMILPELSQEALLAANGKLLILLFTRRLTSQDLCFQSDVMLLNQLHSRKQMPLFSNEALCAFDTPFVDPFDASENVQALSAETSVETREQVLSMLKSGRLVDANVWMALKLRRAAMVVFMESLVAEHQAEAETKPSPTYAALLRAEVEQRNLNVSQQGPSEEHNGSSTVDSATIPETGTGPQDLLESLS